MFHQGMSVILWPDLETFLLKMTEAAFTNGNRSAESRVGIATTGEKTLRFSLDACKVAGGRSVPSLEDGASTCGSGSGTTRIG